MAVSAACVRVCRTGCAGFTGVGVRVVWLGTIVERVEGRVGKVPDKSVGQARREDGKD